MKCQDYLCIATYIRSIRSNTYAISLNRLENNTNFFSRIHLRQLNRTHSSTYVYSIHVSPDLSNLFLFRLEMSTLDRFWAVREKRNVKWITNEISHDFPLRSQFKRKTNNKKNWIIFRQRNKLYFPYSMKTVYCVTRKLDRLYTSANVKEHRLFYLYLVNMWTIQTWQTCMKTNWRNKPKLNDRK